MTRLLLLDLGRACNRKCDYCLNSPDEKFELSTEKAKEIMNEGRSLGCMAVSFTGGEPLLRKDLNELLAYAKSIGYQNLKLQTNGDLLDEEMASRLASAGVTNLLISFHNSNYGKMCRVMEKLLSSKITVEISYVITRKNFRDMIRFLGSFRQYKEVIMFYLIFMMTKSHIIKSHPELMLSLTELKPVLEEMIAHSKKEGYKVCTEGIPRCVLGKNFAFAAEYMRKIGGMEIFRHSGGCLHRNIEIGGAEIIEEKEKFSYCYECPHSNNCFGVWKNYPSFFREEGELTGNIAFRGIFLDDVDKPKKELLPAKKNDSMPLLFRVKDNSLLDSPDFVKKLKDFFHGNKLRAGIAAVSAGIPICWSNKGGCTALRGDPSVNALCEGCLFNGLCDNKSINPNNSPLLKKFYEFPEEAKIEITDKCNKSCSHCFNRLTFRSEKYPKGELLKKEELFDMFSQLKKMGVSRVRLTGGEPFTRNDLGEIICRLKKEGFFVTVNTNLSLETEDAALRNIDDLLVSFKSLPFMDGFNKEKFDAQVNRLKKARGIVSSLSISVILSNGIMRNFSKFADFCEGLDVDNVVCLCPFGIEGNILDYDELTFFMYNLDRLNSKSSKRYVIGNPLPVCMFNLEITSRLVSKNFLFEYGVRAFVIDPYGNLRMNYTNPKCFGSVREKKIVALLKGMKSELNYVGSLAENCRKCINLVECGGMLKESSEYAIEPFCRFGMSCKPF